MIVVYGIPNCDKCRAARKWFDAEGLDYRFHDLREDGLEAAVVSGWLEKLAADQLLNKRSATWRQLGTAQREQAGGAAAVELILEHPTLIKRPLVVGGDTLLVGYDETSWRNEFA